MNVSVNKNVIKDVEKTPNSIKVLVLDCIDELEAKENLNELLNDRKMEGTDEPYYRIRLRNYRLLIHYDKETKTVIVHALTHRKDTYKKENLPFRK